mgnify:CR=1 FL=1
MADQLREKILQGELPEGTDLPKERELREKAGLSRATVREALRILEGEGLIATRIGRNGGSAVARPTRATIDQPATLRRQPRGTAIVMFAQMPKRFVRPSSGSE